MGGAELTGDTMCARIKVVGRVDAGDGAPELIKGEYAGSYTELDGGFLLEYDEDEPAAHVALSCRADWALLERDGEPRSRMEFRPGRAMGALYALNEGEFDLTVECSALALNRSSGRGSLRMAYRLLSAGAPVSDNRLMVSYRICSEMN